MTTKTEAASQVRKVLQQVKDRVAQPGGMKVNEATTRAHFINPLLDGLGYSSIEDVEYEYYLPDGKQFLDYRLKVGGEYRVSVEAKALDVSLTDTHGAQVIQYTSVTGDEWAVVTNARQWRLYHSFVKGPLADKLVQSVDLIGWETDQQFAAVFEQLWLVSRESFETSDGPASWLNKRRIDQVLSQSLTDPGSTETKYLRKRLADQGIAVSADEVALWFKARTEGPVATPQPAAPASAPPVVAAPPQKAATKVSKSKDEPGFWLIPAGRMHGLSAEDHLRLWLAKGFWGFWEQTPGRKAVKAGDQLCFYTAKQHQVLAFGRVTGPPDTPVTAAEWPEPTPPTQLTFKVPLEDVTWLSEPVTVDVALRARLDAFAGRDPSGPWAWLVQTSRRLSEGDFLRLTGRL